MSDAKLNTDDRSGPIAWMARNAIAANLLMVLLLGGGLWAAVSIQKEVFPEFELDIVTASVSYPGASPEEVEQGILRPIEDAIRGVEGIREMTSRAGEGNGSVEIELVAGADRMKVFQDVDQAINRIRTFPDDIEEPEVTLQSRQRDVMEIVLYGPVDIWTLRQLAEQLRDQLRSDPEITQVEIGRAPDYVTHVEIPRNTLREYGLTLPDIAQRIEASSEDTAAGSVETSAGEILLRVKARKQLADEFKTIPIVTSTDGSGIMLGEIARVYDGFEEQGFHSRFNDQLSVELSIFRVGNQSPLEIADAVERNMADFEQGLPPGVMWRIGSNSADDFKRRLTLVIENGLMAVVIVMLILALFLEFRLAFWVMMGMVISFVGGILLMPVAGISINMISLFGFLVVLGIVVDDAIVVGENIYDHREKHESRLNAAIHGAKEMALPVTFSIMTNLIAFVPLLFIPGEMGKFWGPLPVVVMIVLVISLFEALFILPAHLAHIPKASTTGVGGAMHRGQQAFSRGFQTFVNTAYNGFLDRCLSHRYITVSVALSLFILVGGYATSAHMGMIMMPEVAADEIEAGVRLPVGTTPRQAAAIAEQVTRASLRMFDEHNLHEVAEGIKTNVRGEQRFIDVEIVMKPPNERDMTAREVIRLWRDSIGDLPGVSQITFEAERGPGGWRQDISIDLSHSDIDVLEKASQELVAIMESFSNTNDVNDNYDKGKDQFDFKLLPEGRAYGFTPAEIGAQLRGAYFGSLALRLMRGTNEVEVRVKLPKSERMDLHPLNDLVVQAPDGTEVPLMDIVEITRGEAFASINRRDGRRIINVSADVEPKREVGQVIAVLNNEVLPQLRADYPGLTWTFEGSDAEMREATEMLWGGFGFAMAVIYALLAVAFRSYLQPLIVLSAIPFGIIGAVIGHMLLGYDLSLISFMGVIALSGVVVNDSLIMIVHANRKRQGNLSAYDAIHDAGLRRFRPIMLTTLTTFGGLSPIIFESDTQAQYIIPMAISLGFGIVFATAIILLLVPSLYLILEDFKILFGVAEVDPTLQSDVA